MVMVNKTRIYTAINERIDIFWFIITWTMHYFQSLLFIVGISGTKNY